jgi:mRNA interferase YafQ
VSKKPQPPQPKARAPRTVERTGAFKKDYKRESKGQHRKDLDQLLASVVPALLTDQPLPPANADHPLTGPWKDHRECHLKPDLLLIYRKPNENDLELVRLGSHSELFG